MVSSARDDGAARPGMAVDIACVGFGPAMGGFLTTLSRLLESRKAPPPQIACFERAGDLSFGVSGVATLARAIRETFPDLEPSEIPTAVPIHQERLVYLLDPVGASRRSAALRMADRAIHAASFMLPLRDQALALPYVPAFLRKEGGLLFSIGQFNGWVGSRIMATGGAQIWPGMPASRPLYDGDRVVGVRLTDQGTDAAGRPAGGYSPGMDVGAALTVVGDGPVGPVGRQLDERFGLPEGNARHEWAVGMKMVVELPEGSPLSPGTVIHTFGYPEPEIFGFLYAGVDRMASLGIFVPSFLDSPVRTAYRYLQHWMLHPYLWRLLEGGTMRSWGAKSLCESGRRGEPILAGDGYARIGEGSGSTNVLTGSGVDEAWSTGVLLAEGVDELLASGQPFSRANLERAYVARRRASRLDTESQAAAHARDGFDHGMIPGLLGMFLAGMTGGRLRLPFSGRRGPRRARSLAEHYRGRIPAVEVETIRRRCAAEGKPLHDAFMERAGWPSIPYDGKLILSHQDALLVGGKVQAPPGYADHVVFLYPSLCEQCEGQTCVEICSGQAIGRPVEGGAPVFDREKCVHCGACVWTCPDEAIELRAGAGGLHSGQN